MKKTVFATKKYVFHLIIAVILLISFAFIYYAGFTTNSLTESQELAVTVVILGLICDISVLTYRYIRQYDRSHLKYHQPRIYMMDAIISYLSGMGICYYGATSSEGILYWLFAIVGWLITFLFIANANLSSTVYIMSKLVNEGE